MRRYATFQGRYAAWNNWDGPDNVGDEWYGKDSPIQFYGDEPSDVPRNKRLNVYDP
jgi:hypothetical protein